jgi:hypothetical protein
VHVEVVLTSAMTHERAEGALWQTYGWHDGVKVLKVEPAIEAPGLDELPKDHQVNLTPHRPQSDGPTTRPDDRQDPKLAVRAGAAVERERDDSEELCVLPSDIFSGPIEGGESRVLSSCLLCGVPEATCRTAFLGESRSLGRASRLSAVPGRKE